MKKYFFIILISVISLSCEDIDVIETQGWYEEKVVVYAELKANETFEGVRFTRTLPLNETYSIEKAELKGVKAYLKQNGVKIIPLHYIGEGIYNSINSFFISPGDIFELIASYNEKNIYSKTIIPKTPDISNAVFASDNFLEATILPKNNEVYGALWVVEKTDNQKVIASDFYEILNSTLSVPVDIKLRTMNISADYFDYKASTYIKVISFDSAYKEYFVTRNNNQPIDDSFSQSGAPVKWNVSGTGIIGLFIGTAESELIQAH